MKKFITGALLILVLTIGMLVVGAEEPNARVVVSGPTVVTAGEEVTYTVSLQDITLENGVTTAQFFLSFNADFFEYISATESASDGLMLFPNEEQVSEGLLVLNAGQMPVGDPVIVKDSGVITFEVKFKVKAQNTVTSSDVKIVDVDDSDTDSYVVDPDNQIYNFEYNSLSVALKQQLSTPEGLAFDQTTKTASWSAVTGAESYEVQLYKDGQKVGEVVSTSHTTYDFSSLIEGGMGGLFTFTVKATSSDPAWEASAVSQPCQNGVKHKGKLATPSIKITLDKIGGKINFVITDTKNDQNLVSGYTVYIYENGSDEVKAEVPSDASGQSIPVDGTILVPGKQYVFTVKALSNTDENADPETANDDSDESTPTDPVTVDNIKSLKVKNPPKLSYTEGETLNLSAMVITVTYGSGATEDVTFTNFSSYGITVDLKNGADVTMGMNGRNLKVTCGSIAATGSLALTVKSSACQHVNTKKEYEPATCGTDGYDRTVCSLCGVTISEQKLERTGNHAYGEWVVDLEPTEHYNGLRHRDCTTCGHHVTESIPLISDSSESTDLPDTSDLPETTPDDTDVPPQTEIPDAGKKNPLGGVKDLGRIFLTILIVIVVLIVLFIILAIWLESRRNRRRRSRARTNQARNRNGGNRGNYYR